MIEIDRDGSQVLVRLTGEYPIHNRTWTLRWDAGAVDYAILLCDHMGKRLWTCLEKIRKASYEAGYKDGRAKRRKEAYFDGDW